MSQKIEIKIHNLLRQERTPLEVAEILLNDYEPSFDSEAVMLATFNFSYSAGAHLLALKKIKEIAESEKALPLAQLVEILAIRKTKVKKSELDDLVSYANKNQCEHLLERSHAWDHKDTRLQQLHEEYKQKAKSDYKNLIVSLKDKLDFLKSQRMIEEEQKILKTLELLAPDDAEVIAKKQDVRERWARDVLSRPKEDIDYRGHQTKANWPADQQNVLRAIEQAIASIQNKDQQSYYDFSLLFYFMENYAAALDLLKHEENTFSFAWLKVEILLAAGHYINCLDALTWMENQNSADPEMPFACAYVRAQCYYGLGQVATAIEMLKSLVSVRPNYRSAQSLLSVWRRTEA